GEHQAIELSQPGKKLAKELLFQQRGKRFAAFMVDANDLLVACNHSCFYGRDARFVNNDPLAGDARNAQARAERAAGFVLTDYAESVDSCAAGGKVRCDVASGAETVTLVRKTHHRDRRFGRKSRGRSPKIAIEHQIAEHAHAKSLEFRKKALQARQ